MKNRHTLDDRIGEVQDDVNGAAVRNIHRIQPLRVRERDAVFCIGQEVNLVYVERMEFGCLVDNTPMLISADASACDWSCIRRKLPPVDVETVLVLSERDNEVRRSHL